MEWGALPWTGGTGQTDMITVIYAMRDPRFPYRLGLRDGEGIFMCLRV